MQGLVASLLDALWRAPEAALAALLALLPALGFRCLLRAALDRGAPTPLQVARVAAGCAGVGAATALAPVAWVALAHSRDVILAAALAFTVVLASAFLPSLRSRSTRGAALLPITLVVLAAGLAALSLLSVGFLSAAPGTMLSVVEITGESRREIVRFAPSGLPPREEGLRAERLLLSRGDLEPVGEAWIFGRGATLSGEGLHLRTWSGGAWLARFDRVTNDAPSEPGRARLYPAQTTEVEPLGRGIVPGWWSRRQRGWLVALGLEPKTLVSPPLPLLDSHGLTLRATHHLTVSNEGTLSR